ncbi:MAG: OmpA family protein [Planctomycetota bacterium]
MRGTIATGVVMALLVGCAGARKANRENEVQRSVIGEQKDRISKLATENENLTYRLKASEIETRALKDEVEIYRTTNEKLEAKLAADLAGIGVGGDVIWHDKENRLEIGEGLLFDAGQADIKSKGQSLLREVAATLKDRTEMARVEGHTDLDPIKHSNWKSNLDLSVQRAMNVANFLSKNGISPDRMTVAGYGASRPRVAGDKAGDKKRNRRVELFFSGQAPASALKAPVGNEEKAGKSGRAEK